MSLARSGGRSRVTFGLLIGATLALASLSPAAAKAPSGTLTTRDAMIDVTVPGGWEKPIITVGDAAINGYSFEAIPDGISVWNKGPNTIDVFVNHETATVPFPLQAEGSAWEPTANTTTSGATPGSQNDYTNSLLSHLVLNRQTGGVISGEYDIDTTSNFQRFCSQTLADGKIFGFERPLIFLNEETSDTVSRTGVAYPVQATQTPSQGGFAVAFDPATGDFTTVPGMGRLNHENSIAIKGYQKPVLVTGDDTFVSNPPESQIYMYLADSAQDVWDDGGDLYGFKSTAANDYYDFTPGSTTSIIGEFTPIAHSAAIGNQAALESASDTAGVFQFVRIEDMAYDREDPNVIYIADTGRASNNLPPSGFGQFASRNGRIWKMVLNRQDPLKVESLSILYDGDTVALGQVGVIHQPDNLETTANYLYVTEDPSTANQGVSPGRIWQIALRGPNAGQANVVAEVDQSYDGDTSIDHDGFAAVAADGYWESSGIIDVSNVFGEGTFLVTIQAHSLWVDKTPGPDLWTRTGGAWTSMTPDTYPDWMLKREGGQLVLIQIPGG
jgi:hypothetical protein